MQGARVAVTCRPADVRWHCAEFRTDAHLRVAEADEVRSHVLALEHERAHLAVAHSVVHLRAGKVRSCRVPSSSVRSRESLLPLEPYSSGAVSGFAH